MRNLLNIRSLDLNQNTKRDLYPTDSYFEIVAGASSWINMPAINMNFNWDFQFDINLASISGYQQIIAIHKTGGGQIERLLLYVFNSVYNIVFQVGGSVASPISFAPTAGEYKNIKFSRVGQDVYYDYDGGGNTLIKTIGADTFAGLNRFRLGYNETDGLFPMSNGTKIKNFRGSVWNWPGTSTYLRKVYQDSAKTTLFASNADPVGAIETPQGDFSQSTAGNRFTGNIL